MTEETLVTSCLHYHGETEKAVKVSIRGDQAGGFWLPKLKIEVTKISGGKITFDWPQWLAETRGLF